MIVRGNSSGECGSSDTTTVMLEIYPLPCDRCKSKNGPNAFDLISQSETRTTRSEL